MSDAIEVKRGRVPHVTWAERLAIAQQFYSEERAKGKCKVCGKTGYLKAGQHSSGLRGQPVRLCGPDLEKLKRWIKDAGWVCQRCCQTTGGAGGGSGKSGRRELAEIRKKLKPYRDKKQTPETCREYRNRNVAMMSKETFETWLEESREDGRWMDPDQFQKLLDREAELVGQLSL